VLRIDAIRRSATLSPFNSPRTTHADGTLPMGKSHAGIEVSDISKLE
jgi:hypothetical protein